MTKIEVIHSGEEAGFQPPYLCKYKQDWDDIKDSGMKKKKKTKEGQNTDLPPNSSPI